MLGIGGFTSFNPNSLADLQGKFAELRENAFAKADTDGSGGLSVDEFESVRQNSPFAGAISAQGPSSAEIFSSLDGDGDGNLTTEELEAGFKNGPQFSTETFSSLLAIQEQFSGAGGLGGNPFGNGDFLSSLANGSDNPLGDLLTLANGPESNSDNDLIGQLLDVINSKEEDK